ncbi:MAG: tetratricopeptide repeat protein [Bacteroidetes bacterium]|nr:MAG: tetratricopeptide repeat protein [Bacteroidota bacterium]
MIREKKYIPFYLTIAVFVAIGTFILTQFFSGTSRETSDLIYSYEKPLLGLGNEQLIDSANQLYASGKFVHSNQVLEVLKKRAYQEKDTAIKRKACFGLAKNYRRMELFKRAIREYDEVLQDALPMKNESLIAELYDKKGSVYLSMKDLDRSIVNFQKALDHRKKAKLTNEYTQSYINLGVGFLESNNYEVSSTYFEQAITHLKEMLSSKVGGRTYNKVLCYNNLGVIYQKVGKFSQAKKALDEAMKASIELGDDYFLSATNNNLGNYYRRVGDYQNSEASLKESIKLAKKIDSYQMRRNSQMDLAKTFYQKKNYQQGFELIELANEDQEERINRLHRENIANIENEFERYKRKQELEQLKIRKDQVEREKRMALIGIFILLLSAFFIFYLLLRNLNKTKELLLLKEREKKMLNEEIQNYAIFISQRNQVLDQLTVDLRNMERKLPDLIGKEELNDVIHVIKSFQNNASENKVLEEKMKGYSSEFSIRLRERFPELSNRDVQLCELILLDLTSKEIAAMQNIESKSVDMARYRLRKKLKIESDLPLRDFLMNL